MRLVPGLNIGKYYVPPTVIDIQMKEIKESIILKKIIKT